MQRVPVLDVSTGAQVSDPLIEWSFPEARSTPRMRRVTGNSS